MEWDEPEFPPCPYCSLKVITYIQYSTYCNVQENRAVEWDEPEFSDNVGVTSVMASQLPGQHLGLGRQGSTLPTTTILLPV